MRGVYIATLIKKATKLDFICSRYLKKLREVKSIQFSLNNYILSITHEQQHNSIKL